MTQPDLTPDMLAAREKPCEQIDFHTADGVFIKVLKFYEPGEVMLQHKHTYAHAHFVASGSVALFVEGKFSGFYHAPDMVHIEANKFHQLVATEPNTTGLCIHNLHGNPELSVEEEATFDKVA